MQERFDVMPQLFHKRGLVKIRRALLLALYDITYQP